MKDLLNKVKSSVCSVDWKEVSNVCVGGVCLSVGVVVEGTVRVGEVGIKGMDAAGKGIGTGVAYTEKVCKEKYAECKQRVDVYKVSKESK